jgi:hypothetical protein
MSRDRSAIQVGQLIEGGTYPVQIVRKVEPGQFMTSGPSRQTVELSAIGARLEALHAKLAALRKAIRR